MPKFSETAIKIKIDNCPKLASLKSINKMLSHLVNAETYPASDIAEIIKRDPTLTARLLRLVNSVFFGLAQKITNVEEGIIYLGTKQIRELTLATPVIEDLATMNSINGIDIPWISFWQHSIATAMITRELLELTGYGMLDESDYIVGLVHNVGKLVMASAFSSFFLEILAHPVDTTEEICEFERETIGWDHAKIGAYYLEKHKLPAPVIEAVEYHNHPQDAPKFKELCAAVQLADHMVRTYHIQGIESTLPIIEEQWPDLEGWRLLFKEDNPETFDKIECIKYTLERLPQILQGMIEEEAPES